MRLRHVLNGELVSLRTAEISDAPYTLQIRQDIEKTRYLTRFNGTIDSQKAWIEHEIGSNTDCFCVIEDNATNELIGTYGFEGYNKKKGCAVSSHALMFGSPMHNAEAIYLLYDYLFNVLMLNSVSTYILSENNASVGVTKRFGGKEASRFFDKRHGMDIIHFIIQKSDFIREGAKFQSLLSRFAGRMK